MIRQGSSVNAGIFWDNDSLSGLLALELKADLLVLLSDVEGLYSGPPSDPHSRLIHTYNKEKHQNEITYDDKSKVGRGGMTVKVKAAVHAAEAGIPVVITRNSSNAQEWAQVKEVDAREMAVAAREFSRRLQIASLANNMPIIANMEDPIGRWHIPISHLNIR
ncbi:hypothetical protein VNO80_05784 [Phaseolus coccineus]|uniref:Aspartate/glutamate/uridylate kinase domain-containing protein n=1 Tax=Phaseolus coccineus TaxID=3886 RepID=A0AAN9NGC0_PHACN